MLGEAAAKLRTKLGESFGTVGKFATPLQQATTPSLEALQAYSLGRKTMIGNNDPAAAVAFFQHAVSLDPNFDMAYLALGTCYSSLAERSLAAESTLKAYQARERVSQREKFYIEAHYTQHSDTSESGWARDIRLGKEANASRLAAKKREEEHFRETHQTVMTANGRISYAQSEAVNKAAAQRHVEEDARESGKPVSVATGFRVIPADETDFSKYKPEEIKAYLAKQKGGHLLR